MIRFEEGKSQCPICGNILEMGYLSTYGMNPLRWFTQKKGFLSSIFRMGQALRKTKKWYQFASDLYEVKAARCPKCQIGFFSYVNEKEQP